MGENPQILKILIQTKENRETTSAARHPKQQSVILNKAKNPALGSKTLPVAQGPKGEFRNSLRIDRIISIHRMGKNPENPQILKILIQTKNCEITSAARHSKQQSVILSKAKNPAFPNPNPNNHAKNPKTRHGK